MWHVLALALGGRTIAEWKAAMTEDEFDAWIEYYRRWPFDDLHRFHRPAALVSTSLAGGKADEINDILDGRLQWLQPDGERKQKQHTSADRDLFKAAGIRV